MEQTKNSTSNLSTLNASLPYGSRKIIAERTGTSQLYVTRVLLGIYVPDQRVIKAAIEYYIEYQAQQNKLDKDIETALQNGKGSQC